MPRRAAGNIVVQVQRRRGLALGVGQPQHALRRLEEQMAVAVPAVEVQKSQVERIRIAQHLMAQPVRGRQREPALGSGQLLLLRKKHSHARHQQRLRQPLHNRVHQCAQVCLCIQLAAKLHQRLAVVDALLVEHTVDPALNHALERIESQPSQDHGRHQPPLAQALEALMHHLSGERDYAEVQPHQRARRQRICNAALEDKVHVHQPVAHNRPTEGQREQNKAQNGDVGQRLGNIRIGEEGNHVQHGEGKHRQQSAARKPLQLLPLQRLLLAVILHPEHYRRQHVVSGQIGVVGLVQPVLQPLRRRPVLQRQIAQQHQHQSRQVQQRIEQPAAGPLILLRKADSEVQKQRRLQSRGQHVAYQDGQVQPIQHSRVLE